MGIKSTQYIDRESAIDRLKTITSLIYEKNYRELENRSSEHDYDIFEFVQDFIKEEYNYDKFLNIDLWTDKMIGDQMDMPYFRYSIFDNYLISEHTDF